MTRKTTVPCAGTDALIVPLAVVVALPQVEQPVRRRGRQAVSLGLVMIVWWWCSR
ncbi:MAG: hypothetical protein ACJ72N_05365 [Labedaea sp.]